MLTDIFSQRKTTTGIGYTTDSGLRMVGLVNLDGGSYDIRVTADDGFRLNIAGKTVKNKLNRAEKLITGIFRAFSKGRQDKEQYI